MAKPLSFRDRLISNAVTFGRAATKFYNNHNVEVDFVITFAWSITFMITRQKISVGNTSEMTMAIGMSAVCSAIGVVVAHSVNRTLGYFAKLLAYIVKSRNIKTD
jgi:hypothetical protein